MSERVQKAMVITWNSLKAQNSMSGEFWVLSYDVLPYAYFFVTHRIMLGRHGGKCALAYEAHQVLRMCLKY